MQVSIDNARRIILITVLLAGALIVPVAAEGPNPSAYPTETIIIGVLSPGEEVPGLADEMEQGIQMAIDEAIAQGANIQVVQANSGCSQEGQGTAAINQLINDYDVHYVLGGLCTSASKEIAAVAEANGVVMIAPAADGEGITVVGETSREYVFAATPRAGYMARALSAHIYDLGYRNPVVINDPIWYEAHGSETEGAWMDISGTPAPRIAWDPDSEDPNPVATAAKAYNPDALVFMVAGNHLATIAEACNTAGMDELPLFGAGMWRWGEWDCSYLNGATYVSNGLADRKRQVEQDWFVAFEAKYAWTPGNIAVYSYDAASYLLQAIATAGVDDPVAVKNALYALQYDGVTGRGMFDENGDNAKEMFMMQLDETCEPSLAGTWGTVTGLELVGPTQTVVGVEVAYEAEYWSGSAEGFSWDMGDGTDLTGQVISHTFDVVGTYTVTLDVESLMGDQTLTQSVRVLPVQDQVVYLPLIVR